MKSKLLFTIVVLISFSSAYAQNSITPDLKDTQVRATILPLGISLEQKLGDKQSVNLSGGLAFSFYAYSDSNTGSRSEFISFPMLNAEFRNYYNRRYVKKDLEQNSGNYVGLLIGKVFSRTGSKKELQLIDTSDEDSFFMGPVWGFQRNYQSGFHLNLSIGLGYRSGKYLEDGVGFISGGGIGFYFK